jgi:hypothetical protein
MFLLRFKFFRYLIVALLIYVGLNLFEDHMEGVAKDSQPVVASNIGKKVNPNKALRVLNRLEVAEENSIDYDRDLFNHWIDADSNGCDARQEVLARQNSKRKPCDSTTGSWVSIYDGQTTNNASDFDVDHLVPLAEAWGSGAYNWDDQKREDYANDLEGFTLIAVSASSNRSKSDQDPAEWMPENRGFNCQYGARWVLVKKKWSLTIDPAEANKLRGLLKKCSK